ncbi:MAG: hypothetical protein OEW35_14975, partial [Gammaproteobacteria bacterium]|nr:hypothetical protein [Gammaproteobacteria bacterium]
AEFDAGAVGLAINDADVGFVYMTPTLANLLTPAAKKLVPKMYALAGSAEFAGVIGLTDVLAAQAEDIRFEVNAGGNWIKAPEGASAALKKLEKQFDGFGPVVNFAASFPGELAALDANGDGGISQAEVADLLPATFAAIDGAGGNGLLTWDELLAYYDDPANAAVVPLGTRGDGLLQVNEVDGAFLTVPGGSIDADGDGKIDPAGYEIGTGTGAVPIYITSDGGVTKGTTGRVALHTGGFVEVVAAGMSFEKDRDAIVDVATGIPRFFGELGAALFDFFVVDAPEALSEFAIGLLRAEGLLPDAAALLAMTQEVRQATIASAINEWKSRGLLWIDANLSTIHNLQVSTLQVGFADANVFFGINAPNWADDGDNIPEPNELSNPPFWTDLDGDGAISFALPSGTALTADGDGDGFVDVVTDAATGAEFGDKNLNGLVDVGESAELDSDLLGIVVADADFGFVQMTPSLSLLVPDKFRKLVPNFTAALGSADAAYLLGLQSIDVQLSLEQIALSMNNGKPWFGNPLIGTPVVDFQASFPGELAVLDLNGNGRVDRFLDGLRGLDSADGASRDSTTDALLSGAPDNVITYAELLAYYDHPDNGGDNDGFLELADHSNITALERIDTDFNNVIDAAELLAAFDSDNDGILELDTDSLEGLNWAADNGDNAFTYSELLAIYDAVSPGDNDRILELVDDVLPAVLQNIDADQDGKIDPVGYEIFTGTDTASVYADFDGNQQFRASVGWATGAISDFVHVSGSLEIARNVRQVVSLADGALAGTFNPADFGLPANLEIPLVGDTQELEFITVGGTLQAFIGVSGPGFTDANRDGIIQNTEINPEAIGILAQNFEFGLALMTPTNPLLKSFKYYALTASADTLSLVGIPGVTLSANKLLIQVNQSTPSIYGVSLLPVVDFAATFPSELAALDRDGDGIIERADDSLLAFAAADVAGDGQGILTYDELLAEYDTQGVGETGFGELELSELPATSLQGSLATGLAAFDENMNGILELDELLAAYDTDNDRILEIDADSLNGIAAGVEGANGAFEYAELLAAFAQTGDILKLAEIAGAVPSVLLYANTDDDDYLDPAGMQIGTGGVTEPVYLDMDGFLVRAQGQVEFNFVNALIVTGSVAVELGPVQKITLANGRQIDANTLTIGAANVSALVGYVPDGEYWDDANGNNEVDAGELDPNAVGIAITDLDIGLALFASLQVTDPLDAGIYLAGTADVSDDPNVTTDGIALVGVPGVTASGSFGIDINIGLGLPNTDIEFGPGNTGFEAIDFRTSFPGETAALDTNMDGKVDAADNFDEAVGLAVFNAIAGTDGEITYEDLLAYYDKSANGGNNDGLLRFGNANAAANDNGLPAALLLADRDGDGTIDAPGFQVNTGNADAPVFLDFEQSLINFEAVGLIEIANPLSSGATLARADGFFLFNVSDVELPGGGTGPQLSVLAQSTMLLGPDVSSTTGTFFSNEIKGALVLNPTGIAADIQATMTRGASLGFVELVSADISASSDISARIVLNTTGQTQQILIPERFESVIDTTPGTYNPIQEDVDTGRYYYVIYPNAPPKEGPQDTSPTGSPYIVVQFDASLDILNTIEFNGSFRLALTTTQFELNTSANLTFKLLGTPAFTMQGKFDLLISPTLFRVSANASMDIALLGSLSVVGDFEINGSAQNGRSAGVLARIVATGTLGSPAIGLTLANVNGFLTLNTTDQPWNPPSGGAAVAPGSLAIGASVGFDFGALAQGSGSLLLEYQSSVFQLSIDGNLTLAGAVNFNITGDVAVYSNGITLNVNPVSLNANVGFVSLDVTGTLAIDTRPGSFRFDLDLSGAITVASTIKLNGSVSIHVSLAGWSMTGSVGLTAGIFGISGSLEADIALNSKGEFFVFLKGSLFIGVDGFNVTGTASIGVAYVAEDASSAMANPGANKETLKGYVTSLSDTAKNLYLKGTIGVGGEIFFIDIPTANLTIEYSGGKLTLTIPKIVPVPYIASKVVDFGLFSARVYYPSIKFKGYTFTVGTFELVPVADPVTLGRIENIGGQNVLVLNVGNDADQRNLLEDETAEQVLITQGASGFINVTMFGETKSFSTATFDRIRVDFRKNGESLTPDEGGNTDPEDDYLEIGSGVNVPVDVWLGDFDDTLVHNGSGIVTAYGGPGNDELTGGSANDYLDGEGGSDVLRGRAGSDRLFGGEDDDAIVWAPGDGSDTEIDGEGGRDRLQVIGAGSVGQTMIVSANALVGTSGLNGFTAAVGAIPLATVNIEDLTLEGSAAGDSFTINDLAGTDLGSVLVDLGFASTGNPDSDREASINDSSVDTVIVNGTAARDVYTLDSVDADPAPDAIDPTLVIETPTSASITIANASSTAVGDSLTLNSGAGDDLINVLGLLQGLATTINTGDETTVGDTVVVGGNLTNTTAPDVPAGLDNVGAFLTINGGLPATGSDWLYIDDTNGSGGHADGVLTSGNLSGLGLAAGGIDYSGFEHLVISLSGGDDVLTVLSTHAADTVVNGGGGEDVINVRGTSGLVTINGGVDSDTINVGSNANGTLANRDNNSGGNVAGIGALLTVNGDSESGVGDTLNVDDAANPAVAVLTTITSGAVSGLGFQAGVSIVYSGLENLAVDLGNGADTVEIVSTSAITTVRTRDGPDTINIYAASNPTNFYTGDDEDTINVRAINAESFIDAGDHNDTINVHSDAYLLSGIRADLTIHGSGGTDTLNANNMASLSSATNTFDLAAGRLTSTQISGLDMGGQIVYGTIEDLNIVLGSGRDHFTIDSTHAFATDITGNAGTAADVFVIRAVAGPTNIVTGEGADTVTVGDADNPLSQIGAVLDIAAGAGNDRLVLDNSAASTEQTGDMSDARLTGFDMAGRVDHAGFVDVTLLLGSGVDHLTVLNTVAGKTRIDTGDGADEVKIETFYGNVDVLTGVGGDTITLFDGDGDNAGLNAKLVIDGGQDGDQYIVTVAGAIAGSSFVNLKDTGTAGIDELTYKGSSGPDLIQLDTVYDRSLDASLEFTSNRWLGGYGNHGEGLIIAHFDGNADTYQAADTDNVDALLAVRETSLLGATNFQVLNYSTVEIVTIFAGDGPDKIISDDTAQTVNVYGNDGDDQFYVGSVLETRLVTVEGREIAVVIQITHGASFPMNFYGGEGDDYFEVNHNQADIALYGDNGDDTFFIKALLTINADEDLVELDNELSTVSGVAGEGSEESQKGINDTSAVDLDALVYVENANVAIDGGAGFDSVAIVGTVLSDTFYVFTEVVDGQVVQRIFGAGVKLQELLNIERIQIITGAGDDRVYVYGVDLGPAADLVINTGTGSDAVIFGGPTLTFDLNFPTRSRTDYSGTIGFRESGETEVAFGFGIGQTESLGRVVPYTVVQPAFTRTRTVAASRSLSAIKNPVILIDPDGILDTVTVNNQDGPDSLVYEEIDLLRKRITTDGSRVIYPTAANTGATTDLIAQLGSLGQADGDDVRKAVSDYLQAFIVFTDRYDDPDVYDDQGQLVSQGLLSRLLALTAGQAETVTIPAGVSYAAFQDTLDAATNEIITARAQLEAFLAGTGFVAHYIERAHPDPSRSDILYELDYIENATTGQRLAFEAQYAEIIVDSVAVPNLIGVSLVTAAPVDLQVGDGYVTSLLVDRTDQLNTVYVAGERPRIYFGAVEEVTLNLLDGQASELTISNDRFTGKTFVQGGGQADTGPGDLVKVLAIAGQTFVRGGAGNDTFIVGEGTLDRIGSELFLFGEDGTDSVFVQSEGLAGSADVSLDKRTVQHTVYLEKLDKVTNALDFTITDSIENQLIGSQLEAEAIEYARQAAAVSAADLQKVALQAGNELGASIQQALESARTEYQAGIASLVAEQQDNLKTFVEGALNEYYQTTLAIAAVNAEIEALDDLLEAKSEAITSLIDELKDSAISKILADFISFITGTRTEVSIKTQLTARQILDAYAANPNSLTFTLLTEEKTYKRQITLSYPFVKWNLDSTKDVTRTITVAVTDSMRTKILDLKSLASQSELKQEKVTALQLTLANTATLINEYLTDTVGLASGLSQSDLDGFLANARANGADAAARTLVETHPTIGAGLAKISQEINATAAGTLALIDQAIAKANALALATGALDTAIDGVSASLNALRSNISAPANAANTWDKWVRLVRLQLVSDVELDAESLQAAQVKDLWQSIPSQAAFAKSTSFLANAAPTWQDALDLLNDPGFASIVDAYKKAEALASEFTNFKSGDYQAFRAVFRNIQRFETSRQFLEGGFNFEAFKAAFKANVAQLDAVVDLLDKVALAAQYQAQLDSMRADKADIDAVVDRNAAVVGFLFELKQNADGKLAGAITTAQAAYTRTITWFFGYSRNYLLPQWVNDARYVAAKQQQLAAQGDYNAAVLASNDAKADQTALASAISALEQKLAAVEAELGQATGDLDALKETLDQQYRFLRDVSRVAVEVLSATRLDQAGAGFGDAQSLISEILQPYINSYQVTDQPGVGPTSTTTLSTEPGSSSVRSVTNKSDYFQVLTLSGLNASGIHADYDSVENFTLYLGDFADQIDVNDSLGSAGSRVTVMAGGGDDVITLSNEAGPIDPLSTYELSVDDYRGEVAVDGEAGANRLLIDDHGDPSGDTIVQQYGQGADSGYVRVSGMADGDILYRATGGSFANGLRIVTSAGDDDITIRALHGDDHTILIAREGSDNVTVDDFAVNPAASLTIYGEFEDPAFGSTTPAATDLADEDVIDASAAPLRVVVYGQQGRDTIYGSRYDDYLHGGADDDLVIGNAGPDSIIASTGNDIVIGDQGYVRDALGNELTQRDLSALAFIGTIVGDGANDLIDGADGNNIILGGFGSDEITTLGGSDVIIGDNGLLDYRAGLLIRTTDADESSGAGDQIQAGAGRNVVLGGAGGDTITTGDGDDIVVGDHGEVYFVGGELRHVRSSLTDLGGVDNIDAGDGDNLVVAGQGGDFVTTGLGSDLVFGDGGDITFDAFGAIQVAMSVGLADGGNDMLSVDAGNNTVIGGFGTDTITALGGNDIIIGDNGLLDFTASLLIHTTDLSEATGAGDQIQAGTGSNVVLGGAGGDTITTGDERDVILGDHGEVYFVAGVLRHVRSSLTGLGGVDTIDAGDGDNVVVAGQGGDLVTTGIGNDLVFGDGGDITWDALGAIQVAMTTGPADGGADTIAAGAGNNTVLGGFGTDTITTLGGSDTVIGDNGSVDYTASVLISSTDSTNDTGAPDIISVGDGANIVIGGVGADVIDLSGTNNLVLGDHGAIYFVAGALQYIRATTPQGVTGDIDIITFTGGDNVLFGGQGGDFLTTGDGNDLVIGDDGEVLYDADGRIVSVSSSGNGGADEIRSGGGDDVVIGGADADRIYSGSGNDIVFGDHARLVYQDLTVDADPATLDSMTSEDLTIGGGDTVYAGDGDDIVVGGFGDDRLDGGSDSDLVFGDSAELRYRPTDITNPRFQMLLGQLLYSRSEVPAYLQGAAAPSGNDAGGVLVDGIARNYRNPDGSVPAWANYEILDLHHSDAIATLGSSNGGFGNDYIAGGAGHDMIFGQLGDDVIQGDGSIDLAVGATRVQDGTTQVSPSLPASPAYLLTVAPSTDAASDGDDYIEGNGGTDVIFGNLGQDDIIGGSSSLFSLDNANPTIARSLRPDAGDYLFGGSGTEIGHNETLTNEAGDTVVPTLDRHARDADAIAGDNANIYRIVGSASVTVPGTTTVVMGVADTGGFLHFSYDMQRSGNNQLIIVRGVELLDYTVGGPDFNPAGAATDIGAADEIHGESGDDFIYGMVGNDVLFGDSESDDLIGGWGNDWISGGQGMDGVLGDDGRIYTGRYQVFTGGGNKSAADPNLAADYAELLNGILEVDALNKEIRTPGSILQAIIHPSEVVDGVAIGEIFKTVDITPFNLDPDPFMQDHAFDPLHANDIIFGGLGNDFLHGAAGDDAISGAEALEPYFVAPFNPGDVLNFDPTKIEFADYDEEFPRRALENFVLNFAPIVDTNGVNDNYDEDVLFGDLGNDWLVGGPDNDQLFGGFGADLLDADDDKTTGGGENYEPDLVNIDIQDLAYGGGGRDVLIANTGGDRLLDWVGEFNSFIAPFAPFGGFTVSRAPTPQNMDFLYQLSEALGADQSRAVDSGNTTNPERNGEPDGELGVVSQKDAYWQDQTGAPTDPQPGNIPGGPRLTLRGVDFNSGTTEAFAVDQGNFQVVQGRLEVSPTNLGETATAVFHVGEYLPHYFEITAKISTGKPTAGMKANSYLIFDYVSPTDFKYAGINISTDKLEMGYVDAAGWHQVVQVPAQLKHSTDYDVLLAINGTTATLVVNNKDVLSYTYAARVDADGYTYGLNYGLVGLGGDSSYARIDNLIVRKLSPEITFEATEAFDLGAPGFTPTVSGEWLVAGGRYTGTSSVPGSAAMSLFDLNVAPNSYLELEATVSPTTLGGVVFDHYADGTFKFAGILADTNQVVIGHVGSSGSVVYDAVANITFALPKAGEYQLRVSLQGTTVSVALLGANGPNLAWYEVVGHVFNAVAVDGQAGLLSMGGASAFDTFAIRTDDPAFISAGEELVAPSLSLETDVPTLDAASIPAVLEEAIRRMTEAFGLDDAQQALLAGVQVLVGDLPGLVLARNNGTLIEIDVNAAGHGWFVDATPGDDLEFDAGGQAIAGSAARDDMDLLSALMH